MEEKKPTSKTKRVLAWIAIVLILAIYIVGLVFAMLGNGYTIPVVMTCLLLASYLAVYFQLGQALVRLFTRKKNTIENEGEKKDE